MSLKMTSQRSRSKLRKCQIRKDTKSIIRRKEQSILPYTAKKTCQKRTKKLSTYLRAMVAMGDLTSSFSKVVDWDSRSKYGEQETK